MFKETVLLDMQNVFGTIADHDASSTDDRSLPLTTGKAGK
jgi:hypothetical protein